MSDADALWLTDPMDAFSKVGAAGSGLVVSRGKNPHRMFVRWGFTVCMGFVLFRGSSDERVALRKFLETMQKLVADSGDDQTAINQALDVWELHGLSTATCGSWKVHRWRGVPFVFRKYSAFPPSRTTS